MSYSLSHCNQTEIPAYYNMPNMLATPAQRRTAVIYLMINILPAYVMVLCVLSYMKYCDNIHSTLGYVSISMSIIYTIIGSFVVNKCIKIHTKTFTCTNYMDTYTTAMALNIVFMSGTIVVGVCSVKYNIPLFMMSIAIVINLVILIITIAKSPLVKDDNPEEISSTNNV